MKKIILLINLLILGMIFNSCGDNKEIPESKPVQESIHIYKTDIGYIGDFTVNDEGEVFYLYKSSSKGDSTPYIKKISKEGEIQILKLSPSYGSFEQMINYEGIISYVDYESDIVNYSTKTSEISYYKIKNNKYQSSPQLSAIQKYKDSYLVFDKTSYSLKQYIPSLDKTILIAGSERKGIKDGTGLDVSFEFVSKIQELDGVFYLIDGETNLRQVKKNDKNIFEVTTIISNYKEKINDLTVDKERNLLLCTSENILKLSKENNKLDVLLSKKGAHKFEAKGDYFYFYYFGFISKISIEKAIENFK